MAEIIHVDRDALARFIGRVLGTGDVLRTLVSRHGNDTVRMAESLERQARRLHTDAEQILERYPELEAE